jgi:hypothetical protein
MNLEQVDRIAGSLLQFESSISAELEAELLTGKQLNLEKARYYALTNDAAGLAEELSKNVGTSAEFGKMNRLEQEAYAKALGMSREELADMVTEQDKFNKFKSQSIKLSQNEVDIIKEEQEKKIKNDVKNSTGTHKVSGRNKSNKDNKKLNREVPEEFLNRGSLAKLTEEINELRGMIKSATLNDAFIPNRKMHQDKWAQGLDTQNAFTSNIDENTVSDIMALNGVDNTWKVLLMMGIGVFINHENIAYTEIMKNLADEQRLYMIIATSDYIYGTNYQFCHGFLSKDLNLTQEKVIQAMGRIGRNNIQQTYTVRFRDDEQILKLFTSETEKPEIINMNRLFNTRKVIWKDNLYVEVPDDIDNDFGTDNNVEEDEEEDEEY